jgi:hypothetical protein
LDLHSRPSTADNSRISLDSRQPLQERARVTEPRVYYDLSGNQRTSATLPLPSPVFPQNICSSSIAPSGSLASENDPMERDHNSFQHMVDSGLFEGWPVKL